MILYRTISDHSDLGTRILWHGSLNEAKSHARSIIPASIGDIVVDKFKFDGKQEMAAAMNESQVEELEGEIMKEYKGTCDPEPEEYTNTMDEHGVEWEDSDADEEDDDDMEDLLG